MLKILLPKDLENIRARFAEHPLLVAIQDACYDSCSIPQYFQFRSEHVFVEVIFLLDELKEKQIDVDWSKLHFRITQDYKYLDHDIPDNDLDCIASIICTTLASILTISVYGVYHDIAKMLFQQAFAHDLNIPRDKLFELCDRIEENEEQLSQWIEEYIQSEEFTSEVFESLFANTNLQTELGFSEHIQFVSGISVKLRNEFLGALKRTINNESNYGKAKKVKGLLLYYKNEGVIELKGTESDIYKDLKKYFGYNQSESTFYAAEPKLGKN